MGIKVLTLYDVLKDPEKYRNDIPKWMIESFQNHRSTWVANSRGGEPNHNKDLKIIIPCKEDKECQ